MAEMNAGIRWRLSTSAACSTGTRNSPGTWPWNSRLESTPAVLSVAAVSAGVFFFLPVSEPKSCATALAGALLVERTPASFSALSMAGRALANTFFMSVMRNSRKAVCWTMFMARAGSLSPGNSTRRRQLPTICTTGSSVPNSLSRVRTIRSAREMASLQSATGPLDWSTSRATWTPPCRSRPRLIGTRRSVVSFIWPVTGSILRTAVWRGRMDSTLSTTRMPIKMSRERIVFIASLWVEAFPRHGAVALELRHELLAGFERAHVAEATHPLDPHRFAVYVCGEVEQMHFQPARRDAEGRPRPLIHHPAPHAPRAVRADGIHAVGRQQLLRRRRDVEGRDADGPAPPAPCSTTPL